MAWAVLCRLERTENEHQNFADECDGDASGCHRQNVYSVGERARQVMMLICVGIFALMGMIAVVADFSFMQHQKNMMQTAADSAAMAGAEELNYGDQVAAGKADAASNGYTDGQAASP